MEQTLGKRIVAHRKRLGLTQDRLAELLGVTAQAVSKWENDQSCPDIAMLPRLAEVFSVTTDELLGIEKKQVQEAEVVEETGMVFSPDEKPNLEFSTGDGENTWEFKMDSSRKGNIALAVWVLLMGAMFLVPYFLPYVGFTFWELVWTTGLFVFGIFGLYPKFSFFRLGCAFFGGYFLLETSNLIHVNLGMNLIVPIVLLMFGFSLLVDAFRKPPKARFQITHNGKNAHRNTCDVEGECFDCATSFGENSHLIRLPRLSAGKAEVSFGELTVDLSGCEEISENCHVELNCSFGELKLLVPGRFRVEPQTSTAFAAMEVKGSPDADAVGTIFVEGNASFGEIEIKYC